MTTTYPIDAETAAFRDRQQEAWTKFADTQECADLWVLLAVIEEAGRLAAEWLDDLPGNSPAREMTDAAELLADVQAIGRACRLFGQNIESIAPAPPPLRVVLVQTRVADLRLGGMERRRRLPERRVGRRVCPRGREKSGVGHGDVVPGCRLEGVPGALGRPG